MTRLTMQTGDIWECNTKRIYRDDAGKHEHWLILWAGPALLAADIDPKHREWYSERDFFVSYLCLETGKHGEKIFSGGSGNDFTGNPYYKRVA